MSAFYELGSSGYFVTNLVHSANGDAGGYDSISDTPIPESLGG